MTAPKLYLKVEKSLYPMPWTEMELEPGSYIIGRSPYAHIIVPDKLVSRRHARVFYANNKWYIEDLGSKNGTILDDNDIRNAGPVELRGEHDLILGTTIIKVRVVPAGPAGKGEEEAKAKESEAARGSRPSPGGQGA